MLVLKNTNMSKQSLAAVSKHSKVILELFVVMAPSPSVLGKTKDTAVLAKQIK